MSQVSDAARALSAAFSAPGAPSAEALADHLTDDVAIVGPICAAEGKDNVLAALENPRTPALFAQASWSEPSEDGTVVSLQATLPPGAPIAGMDLTLTIVDGRIAAIDESLLRAPPPTPSAVDLGADIAEALSNALSEGAPVVVGYVGPDNAPHLSFRGSTQVYDADHLAIWIRDPEGGILGAVRTNPKVSLVYRNGATGHSFIFTGRAAISEEPDVAERVYQGSPQPERAQDPQRKGRALLIEIDTVAGRGPNGPFRMERASS
jgi:hypothetical protein